MELELGEASDPSGISPGRLIMRLSSSSACEASEIIRAIARQRQLRSPQLMAMSPTITFEGRMRRTGIGPAAI